MVGVGSNEVYSLILMGNRKNHIDTTNVATGIMKYHIGIARYQMGITRYQIGITRYQMGIGWYHMGIMR